MTRDEVRLLLRQVAATWPGTPITHEAVDLWFAACGSLAGEQAAAALAHWTATSSHPPRPADLNAAWRAIDSPPPEPRAEARRPLIDLPPAHHRPDVAHAELARMRAILGTTPYRGRR